MVMEYRLTVSGEPVPKARARVVRNKATGRVMSFTPDKTAAWENRVAAAALDAPPPELLDGPLAAELTFYFTKPQTVPRKRQFPTTKPDLDNCAKAIFDALEGILYVNDSRFVDKVLHKRYGQPPRVEILIRALDDQQERFA